MQQILQQQWRPIGVELTINNKPAAVLFGDFYRLSKFETIFNGIPVAAGDPDITFRLDSKYIPAKGGKGRNSVAYENPQVDQLSEAGAREMDREKRKKIYGTSKRYWWTSFRICRFSITRLSEGYAGPGPGFPAEPVHV